MATHTLNPSAPNLEALEDRLTPSNYLSLGDIVVSGTSSSDSITVSSETHFGTGWYRVNENGVSTWWNASLVTGGDVFLHGNAGNDTLRNDTALRTYADGGGGNDALYGNLNGDYLDGGTGVDWIYGYGGDDVLVAGYDASTNYVHGGAGNDTLHGGFGNDNLSGEDDHDVIYGYAGHDTIWGGNGNDVAYGGDGNDELNGGLGVDWLYGEAGDDLLSGYWSVYDSPSDSWDYLSGGSGADVFYEDLFWSNGSLVQRDVFLDFTSGVDRRI